MKTIPFTVHGLRQNGYKVRNIHKRPYMVGAGRKQERVLLSKHDADCLKEAGVMISEVLPKGGFTLTEIDTPENIRAVGVAVCAGIDSFNYKIGTKSALQRAMGDVRRQLSEAGKGTGALLARAGI